MTPRLSQTLVSALIAVLSLALTPAAFAAPELGDAGDLRETSQDLGADSVTAISGTFASASDADLYRLCLFNGTSFSASTVGGTTPSNLDTQLFLFDSQGHGVYANDDASGSRGSRLPANHRFSPQTGGEYFLAVSPYNQDPQSLQGEIFADNYSFLSYPDGVIDANGFGAAGALDHWNGRWPGGPGGYVITLTGTAPCDTTPPTVDLRTPADGARVKQGEEVVVDFSCSDEGGSGLASCVGTSADGEKLDTSSLGELSVTVTARDGVGNQTVVTHTVTVVDATPPTIALDSPADGAVYERKEEVLADYSCADEPGGSGLATCAGPVAAGAAVDTSTLGEHTFTVEATDEAGNPSSASATYTVVDGTPPTISLTTPADGAVYELGESVTADYECADEAGGSGVATCDGTVADGDPIDTSSAGPHSFEVETSDNAGNSDRVTVSYGVVYDFDGFLPPVENPPSTNRWKAGLPVPIRFSLNGYQGARPEAAGFPQSRSCDGSDAEMLIRAAKKGPVFHYQRRFDRYVLIWTTQRRWMDSCREFVLELDDGTVHTARFQFTKN